MKRPGKTHPIQAGRIHLIDSAGFIFPWN